MGKLENIDNYHHGIQIICGNGGIGMQNVPGIVKENGHNSLGIQHEAGVDKIWVFDSTTQNYIHIDDLHTNNQINHATSTEDRRPRRLRSPESIQASRHRPRRGRQQFHQVNTEPRRLALVASCS